MSPRVLYLTPDLFGPPSGVARYCRMVCRALTQSGYRVSVISLLDRPDARSETKKTFPRLRYVPCNSNRPQFVWRACLRALKMRPDVILIGHPNFAPLGQVLARLTGAKVVNFIYGIDAWTPLSSSRRRALCAGDLIVSISRFTATRAAEENGIPSGKVRILHNCLDPHFQNPHLQAEPLLEGKSLLTVARISKSEQYKGHDVVIRALPGILQKFPDARYNIVGDGDGRMILESLVKEIGVEDAVRFYGAVSEEELIRHYNTASVFVMPSRFEGFGFVFLEAMTYGKPVVCGNEDASVEVVDNGVTGYTVNPQDSDAVAEAVSKLLSDDELRERMGRDGIERVEHKFGFDKFHDTLRAYLSEIGL